MAKLAIEKDTTDVTVYIFAQDSSETTGAGLTGLVYNTTNLVASYVRPLAARTAITLATQTVTGAHSDGGFVEVDATNMPGVYRLDLPDAVCATGVDSVVVMLKGAADLAPVVLELQLTDTGSGTSAADIADAVWDEILSGHSDVGSTGAALAAAGGSGDPWSTALPGSYGEGTAGKILSDAGTNISTVLTDMVDVDDILTPLAVVDTNVDSILADTGTDGVVLTAAAVDAVLDEVVVGTYTMRQILTILASAMAGKVSGGGTSTITFRGINDASDVIIATVDASGNRTALTVTV